MARGLEAAINRLGALPIMLRPDELQLARGESLAVPGWIYSVSDGLLRDLEGAGVGLESIEVARPTLDDVFLTLTGRPATAERPSSWKRRWRLRVNSTVASLASP